ncbi:MAG: hypothetical protein IKI63_04125, partial [Clostridia bacterium]|nr:hypothetical protein [Clostridia bacterium]
MKGIWKNKRLAVLSVLTVLALMLTIVGSVVASAAADTRGDLNGDGAIDMKDVLLLRKSIANIGDPA